MSSVNSLTSKKFSFSSAALGKDTFEVVSFEGTEGISKLYRFDISLVSENDELDLESLIQSRATLTILRDDGDIVFNGILSTFEQLGTAHGQTRYRAVLTPAFWRQTLTHHNQIFLDKNMPQIIEAAMKDGGLTSLDYSFRLTGLYENHEYICQYNESHFNFISRLMEREGIYYYFEQGEYNEKVIIADSAMQHSVMQEGEKLYYSPISGLDEASREEVIKTLVCSQKMLPKKIVLKDYNYRKPLLELTAEYVVSERGVGDVFIYGEHFSTEEEGARLAQMRAEALKCRARVFQGESLVPYLRPGYIFNLKGHNRNDFNADYLTTSINHSGDQNFMFTSGLDVTDSHREGTAYYSNSFSAILLENQFRPERTTEKPRISGTLNAHIDAAGSGEYAEIDEQGRYKVRLPFDLSDPLGGKASSWLRMAQPYAGSDHGMHFPLHKDTEVLLTFIDGDPDRPIIAAAVPNPLSPSPVIGANATQSHITTAGGNKFHLEDQAGGERILLQTPKANTSIRMGSPNAPLAKTETLTGYTPEEIDTRLEKLAELIDEKIEYDGVAINTVGNIEYRCEDENTYINGNCLETILGTFTETVVGAETNTVFGERNHISLVDHNDVTVGILIDAVAGFKIELACAASAEFAVEHVFVSPLKTELAAITTEIGELKTHVDGAVVKCTAAKNECILEATKLAATTNTVAGLENKMASVKIALSATNTALSATSIYMDAAKTEMAGESIKTTGTKTEMNGENTQMSANLTHMTAAHSILCSANNVIAGIVNIL